MAVMHRKRNLFEKLAPLWAVIAMGLYVGAMLYYFFIADDFESLNTYDSWLQYLLAAVVILCAYFSFVPESVVSIVKHTAYYLVSGGIGLFVLYWYINNRFTDEDNEARMLMAMFASGSSDESYKVYYFKYSVISTVFVCIAVAAFCAIKYHLSSKSWINKRIK